MAGNASAGCSRTGTSPAATCAATSAAAKPSPCPELFSEAALEVRAQVLHRFQTHRDAQEAFADPSAGTRFGRNASVGGGGRMRDGRLGVAEIGGDGNHAGRIDDAPCRF